jgi:hypothetical protein
VVRLENHTSKAWEIVRILEDFLAEEPGQARSKWEVYAEVHCVYHVSANTEIMKARMSVGARTNSGLRTQVRVPPFRRTSCRSRSVSVGREQRVVPQKEYATCGQDGAAYDHKIRARHFQAQRNHVITVGKICVQLQRAIPHLGKGPVVMARKRGSCAE